MCCLILFCLTKLCIIFLACNLCLFSLNRAATTLEKIQDGISGKQWLTSDHMGAVNHIMIDAHYLINGFQDTLLAPKLQKDGMWFIPSNGFQSQASPSVNIHHNSQKHWVTSFQLENGDIHLLDSSVGKQLESCINGSLKIQLAQIYGKGKAQLVIKIPDVQQQNNGYDCGLFVIANMVKFAINGYKGL